MRRCSPWLVLLPLIASCRDEQAGPRPRGSSPPPVPPAAHLLSTPPGDLTFRSAATWEGGALEYLGARVGAVGQDGMVLVANYFRATRAPTPGYGLFMHILDGQTGEWLANADHPLPLPGGQWPVGKVVEDAFRLRVPVGRTLDLRLGFYKGDARLPLDSPAMQDGQGRVRGPMVGVAIPLPEYHVHRRTGAIVLDGKLDEEAWSQAPAALLTRSLDGGPVAWKTEARLLYDDHFLYVGFDCSDADVWGTFRQRDEPLYTQEVVEIFLDSNADGATYHELEVSPHNVLFDAYFPARRTGMDLSWDSGAQSAVNVRGTLDDASDRDDGWSVELKVPLDRLKDLPPGSPRSGARWRFNLYRLEQPDRKSTEGQAFSPPRVGDFHHLPRFGWLVFD